MLATVLADAPLCILTSPMRPICIFAPATKASPRPSPGKRLLRCKPNVVAARHRPKELTPSKGHEESVETAVS